MITSVYISNERIQETDQIVRENPYDFTPLSVGIITNEIAVKALKLWGKYDISKKMFTL